MLCAYGPDAVSCGYRPDAVLCAYKPDAVLCAYRPDRVPDRGGAPVGEQAAGRPLASRPPQHTHLLQHTLLLPAHRPGPPRPLLLTHHEALEEDEPDRHEDARTQRLPALLRPHQPE